MKKSLGIVFVVLLIAVLAAAALFAAQKSSVQSNQPQGSLPSSTLSQRLFAPSDQTKEQPAPPAAGAGITQATTPAESITVVAENLSIPWEIVWLPDGTLLVTERPGRLLLIEQDTTAIPITGVEHVGEGGLLGLAVHPQFAANGWIYLYLTTAAGDGLFNRVERYQLTRSALTDKVTIIDNIPGARFHDGGRIAFGPDGLLYITTGDAGDPANAQNLSSLAGKILRLNDDGTVPSNNPFNTAVYSWGHRNPQGLAWDEQGRLWATEHGRSGIRSGFDELNLIEPGNNYGWPDIQGNEEGPGLTAPIAHSGSAVTWAPAGAAFLDGSIFFAGLRGQALYEARIGEREVSIVEHFNSQIGRLRAVAIGPDGFLYVSTSNQDGRGRPQDNDDRIIRIDPAILGAQ